MDFNPQKYQLRAEKTFKSVNMKLLQYYLVIYMYLDVGKLTLISILFIE